jgi:hypothetical protein
VPEIAVLDQLRSAVSGPLRYDPDINPTYVEMAQQYGVTVNPACPAIAELLERLKGGRSRGKKAAAACRSKRSLRPLPPRRHEIAEWKKPTVNIDYCVEFDQRLHRVPYTLVKERGRGRSCLTVVGPSPSSQRPMAIRAYRSVAYLTVARRAACPAIDQTLTLRGTAERNFACWRSRGVQVPRHRYRMALTAKPRQRHDGS